MKDWECHISSEVYTILSPPSLRQCREINAQFNPIIQIVKKYDKFVYSGASATPVCKTKITDKPGVEL